MLSSNAYGPIHNIYPPYFTTISALSSGWKMKLQIYFLCYTDIFIHVLLLTLFLKYWKPIQVEPCRLAPWIYLIHSTKHGALIRGETEQRGKRRGPWKFRQWHTQDCPVQFCFVDFLGLHKCSEASSHTETSRWTNLEIFFIILLH